MSLMRMKGEKMKGEKMREGGGMVLILSIRKVYVICLGMEAKE